jgi:hypothetical protein
MRMIDDTRDRPIDKLWLYLTQGEADQLVAALRERAEDAYDPEWHVHIESEGDTERSLSVAIYDPSALPEDATMHAFLKDGSWPS